MKMHIEYTDTFGGEANYSWVRRWEFGGLYSDLAAVRKAKKVTGFNGYPCRVDKFGEMIAIYPRDHAQVIFITFED